MDEDLRTPNTLTTVKLAMFMQRHQVNLNNQNRQHYAMFRSEFGEQTVLFIAKKWIAC
ncbi:unnamed protein product, partial [Rotaria magnacalcarata]